MKRHTQTLDEVKNSLSIVETQWRDQFADDVISELAKIEQVDEFKIGHFKQMFDRNYDVALSIAQILMGKSKDEFRNLLKTSVFKPDDRVGKTLYKKDPIYFLQTLNKLNLIKRINDQKGRSYTLKDILTERLKSGRGSAIKGQFRGKFLEDFVEDIIREIAQSYDARCNFIGKDNHYVAKADFAIPNKDNPNIVIEVKAYGATGSKQTDSIGDVDKIIKHKRHDTYFIFVTDGITWMDRLSDLNKLVKYQNEGFIYKIYTQSMKEELKSDLIDMLNELRLIK
jgi:hypothetical protein